jgi:syntaxin-binding protein 1
LKSRKTHLFDKLGIHLYLTDRLPDDLFSFLAASRASKKIAALREIDVAFIPFESRVFLLDEPRFYKRIVEDSYRQRKLQRLAEQLNTVAIALGGDFDLFFQSQISNCVDLASLTRKKLNQNGRLSATIGDMIIVDRSYDPFAPLLHELTYQAMTYDVLRADGDIVKMNRQLLTDNFCLTRLKTKPGRVFDTCTWQMS